MPPPPFRDLIDESLDEACFLLQRWEAELVSLTRNLDEVWSWTEERLHGALDGVRIDGTSLVELAAIGLGSGDASRTAVCAGLLGASDQPAALDVLATALTTAEAPALAAMVRGLELLASPQGLAKASASLHERGASGLLCRLAAFHRMINPHDVQVAFAQDSPSERCDAVRAARYLPPGEGDELLADGWQDSDPLVRLAAIESGVARGMRQAWDATKAEAATLGPDTGPYLRLVAMFGRSVDHEVVYDAINVAELRHQAVWALGHIGTTRALEACLAGMQDDSVARACGEAYAWITGANLERDRLNRVDPQPDSPAFEEDDLDANLVPSPDEWWPLPDPGAVQLDWDRRRGQFAPDARHIGGQPMTTEAIVTAIETGPMLRRPDLILTMSARTRGRYDVETRAFVARQQQMMRAVRDTSPTPAGR